MIHLFIYFGFNNFWPINVGIDINLNGDDVLDSSEMALRSLLGF